MMRVSKYWIVPLAGCLLASCQTDQLTYVDPFGPNAPLSAAERPVAADRLRARVRGEQKREPNDLDRPQRRHPA